MNKTLMGNILSSWLLSLSSLVHRNKINKQAIAIIINSLAIMSKIRVSEKHVMKDSKQKLPMVRNAELSKMADRHRTLIIECCRLSKMPDDHKLPLTEI